MRISDWSSDVCSSDLLDHGDPDNAADALAACDFPASLLEDPALRFESTGSLASRASVHPQVRAALFQRQVDFANQPGGAVLRSEEHTSELQSLMRISYAVFCLKKNPTTIIFTHPHHN